MDDASPAGKRSPELPATPLPLRGRRILLVAADPLDEFVVRESLDGQAEVMLAVATSATGALEQLLAQAPDAVLLDLELPGVDEHALVHLARALRGSQRVLIALAPSPEAPLPAGAPFDGAIGKPLHPRMLLHALASGLAASVAAATRAPAAPPPPVSFELGLERCLGRRDLYGRVVRRFLEHGAGPVEEIAEALAQADRKTAARHAHSLVSTAGILGAMALSEGARLLYTALAATDADADVSARVASLADEAAQVRQALQEYVRASAGEAGGAAGSSANR